MRFETGCLVVLLGAAPAEGGANPLRVEWSVDGGPPIVWWPMGDAIGKSVSYEGSIADPVTGLVLDYDLVTTGGMSVGGNFSMINTLATTIDVNIEVTQPIGTLFLDTLLVGQGVVGITTGADGGQIGSQPPYLYQTLLDGVPIFDASLFYDPFQMGISGPGSAAAFADFGAGRPIDGPAVSSTLGYSLGFTLTNEDLVSITTSAGVVGGTPDCPADLNHDGQIGVDDMLLLLGVWGDTVMGPPDLNEDGIVGFSDLAILLSAWGWC